MKSMTIILLLSMIAFCSCSDEPVAVTQDTLNDETTTESASQDFEQEETEEETVDEDSMPHEETTKKPEPEKTSKEDELEEGYIDYLAMSFEELVDVYDKVTLDGSEAEFYASALCLAVEEDEIVDALSSIKGDNDKMTDMAFLYVSGMFDEKRWENMHNFEREMEKRVMQEEDYDKKYILYTLLREIQVFIRYHD